MADTLFDLLAPPAKTRARATDPATSKAAAAKIKTGSQYAALIMAADYHNAYTAHELGQRAGLNPAFGGAHKRIPELVALEFLRVAGTRICTFSGHDSQTYTLTQPGLSMRYQLGGE